MIANLVVLILCLCAGNILGYTVQDAPLLAKRRKLVRYLYIFLNLFI